jgi:hypothetical protein
MLTDRYDLVLSTASSTAGDAYVQASDLALTFYPGAAEAYDRAIAADRVLPWPTRARRRY